MDYTWEKLSSREFEIIACNFAGDMFPGYEWKLTANTRDYNHDFLLRPKNWINGEKLNILNMPKKLCRVHNGIQHLYLQN